ncbi:MAG TPA: PQQ-binding-like beta-propeller repeat protein, partial [Yinghuangia sp.]|nr:PQQ-binding-like beta-propeller repeat protein [Yinghuangia sp.]
TWHGRPALLAEHVARTPSDGVSPEKYAWVIDVFDDQGRRLAHKEYPGRDKPLIADGRRVVVEHGTGGNSGALVVSDAGGDAPGWRIPCQDSGCVHEGATVAAGVVVHSSRQRVGDDDIETLAAFDPNSGAPLWTTRDLARPAEVPATADAELIKNDGGKLVLAWYVGTYGAPRFHTETYSVHDPATGRLLATGPTLPGSAKTGLATPDGTVMVVATTDSTAAWETGTGKPLWQQAKDEKRLAPVAVVGPVLYSGQDPSMAVDLRTKTVLQRTVSDMPVPVGTEHAVVTRAPGVAYVFAVQRG